MGEDKTCFPASCSIFYEPWRLGERYIFIFNPASLRPRERAIGFFPLISPDYAALHPGHILSYFFLTGGDLAYFARGNCFVLLPARDILGFYFLCASVADKCSMQYRHFRHP
jgi:hypothetical protein